MRCWLYNLAFWYIGKCNSKWEDKYMSSHLKKLRRLTYRDCNGRAYLCYGADAEWRNVSRYKVLDYAIQKLAEYEDQEKGE